MNESNTDTGSSDWVQRLPTPPIAPSSTSTDRHSNFYESRIRNDYFISLSKYVVPQLRSQGKVWEHPGRDKLP
ncbi:hypothetical protein EVAR_18311_1 [Eumeta japonica]|uniref:Uncharacterized protein n=1 Tax=Eumeta variegata TaxID=151549 RepID=A0A4C1V965_EUMVA|nr:hypothetical protein EVAR_18311_1 [Eumeta japonica]